MHGAAMAFSFLMQPGAAVVELFPTSDSANWHMEFIAKQSGHHYISWKNKDSTKENKTMGTTELPVEPILKLMGIAFEKMCPTSLHVQKEKKEKK